MVYRLSLEDKGFPDPELAEREEPYNGLLAVGGDLSAERLLNAYRSGIFPWYEEGGPILWWSPDPRFVLFPSKLHVSRSLERVLKKGKYEFTFDTEFEAVMKECGRSVPGRERTWITEEMVEAYVELHRMGCAHSVEARLDGKLVGGLYGVSVGRVFCGESMFSREPDASKAAFVAMVRRLEAGGTVLIDCQVWTDYLASFGAEMIPRKEFLENLRS
jgi:leucyl/phenylalanyl-tRNA--protein transferase